MIANNKRRAHFGSWPILVGLVTLLAMCDSRAGEWLMKVEGVPGELTEGPRAGWTLVKSVSPIVVRPVPTNSVIVPAAFSCKVKKGIDRTSPLLAQNCGRGNPVGTVTFTYTVTNPGSPLYRITLNGVLVGAVSQTIPGQTPECGPEEEMELRFQKIEWTLIDLDTAGGATGGLTARFNQATGEGSARVRPALRATISRHGGQAGVRVSWPGESGHRYRVLSCAAVGDPWKMLLEKAVTEDGLTSEFVAFNALGLFMRVEEVE